MDKYLYLFLNFISILFPLLFSFYAKASFYRQWKFAWPAILFPALLFIIWDELFTSNGIWGFNPSYLTGIYLFDLPLEEILFFICIPYACLFTYFAFNHLIKEDYFKPYQRKITTVLIPALLATGVLYLDKWYTSVTFIGTGLFLFFHAILLKPDYMGRFYFTFIVILLPFFLINGILTGSFIEGQVVWYNEDEIIGIRLGTIPLEDTCYGLWLILMNVTIFEQLKRSKMA